MIDKEFEDNNELFKLSCSGHIMDVTKESPIWANKKLEEQIATYKAMCLKDHSIAHPMMKQQYTYKDLKAAFEQGYLEGAHQEMSDFDDWWKNYKFEMTKENGTG